LLDLRQEDVRNTLDELDTRARQTRQGKVVLGSVALIGIPAWFAVFRIVGGELGILVGVGLASVTAAAIMRYLPVRRRMPELTDAELASIRSDATGNRR